MALGDPGAPPTMATAISKTSHMQAVGLSSASSAQLYDASLAPRAIRILILEPSSGSDGGCDDDATLLFGLENSTLEEAAGTYEALSYAWGLESATEPIMVNGVALRVRPNLAAAFRQLRSADRQRRLWVDFLCINQSDQGERGRQVAHMFDIYARSSQVLLWLGPAAHASDAVLDYLAALNAPAESREHAQLRSRQRVADPRPHALADPAAPRLPAAGTADGDDDNDGRAWVTALDRFLSRPWFRRYWVQQEAAACPRTTVLCGTKTVGWDHMFALAWRMMRGHNQFTEAIAAQLRSMSREAATSLRLIRLIHLNRQRTKASLLYVLHAARVCEAADPRDRIYSVQHLARQASPNAVLLDPDYNIPMSELCIRFAECYILQRGPSILAHAGRAAQDPERAKAMPSWVPDWENAKRHHLIGGRTENAGGRRSGTERVERRDGQRVPSLFIEGLIITTLEAVGGFVVGGGRHVYAEDAGPEELPAFAEIERATYEAFVDPPTATYRDTDETLHTAYSRLLVADSIPSMKATVPAAEQCREWRSVLQRAAHGEGKMPSLDAEALEASLAELQLRDAAKSALDSTAAPDPAKSESQRNGTDAQDPRVALACSMYALNLYKTGSFARMKVARGIGGWLLLVPNEAQVGDQVCLVRGFGRGLIIRESIEAHIQGIKGQEEDTDARNPNSGAVQHEIVGEAYLHGAMQGELLRNSDEADVSWSELEFI